jgi:hypothetical protein
MRLLLLAHNLVYSCENHKYANILSYITLILALGAAVLDLQVRE